jgi:hypothetical protein
MMPCCTDAGHGAHQARLHTVDGIVANISAGGPLLLHGDDHAVDDAADVGLGVEEDQVPL